MNYVREQAVWLIFDKRNVRRMTKKPPRQLGKDERAVKVKLSWDPKMFEPTGHPEVGIEVREQHAIAAAPSAAALDASETPPPAPELTDGSDPPEDV